MYSTFRRIVEKEYRFHIWGEIIGAGMSMFNGINQANADTHNRRLAKQNLQFQKEQFDYQKALQQDIFNREDTAHQREVNDLRQAGINPLATANGGQGAGAGAVVETQAMHNDYEQKPVQLDPYAAMQASAQLEAVRNNKATEKIEEERNKNDREKIESDETLKLRELELKELRDQNDKYLEMYKIEVQNKNTQEAHKIQKRMIANQEQMTKILNKHYGNMDENTSRQLDALEKELNEIKIPQAQRDAVLDALESEELQEEIQSIRINNELDEQQKKMRISQEIRNWVEVGTDVADTVAGIILPWKNIKINQQNADSRQMDAETNRMREYRNSRSGRRR